MSGGEGQIKCYPEENDLCNVCAGADDPTVMLDIIDINSSYAVYLCLPCARKAADAILDAVREAEKG